MTHEELRGLLPAYALDALDLDEAREAEAHLPACPECRQEVAALGKVAGTLAGGVRMVDPPAALRARILEAVRPGERAAPPRPAGAPAWSLGVAALAASAALVLAGVSVSLNQRLAALNQQVAVLTERLVAQEQVLALLASPSARTTALEGAVQASVRFVYDPARRQGALVVTDLRDPGTEFVYQLWLVAGQEPESAGVFRPAPGRPIIVPVTADFSRYQAVAISVERAPSGAPRPSAAPILVGKIQL